MTEEQNTPLVSIIMPTYNRSGLIIDTVKSILCQTHRHWELIIVDDGSDDDTEEKIRQIKDRRIHFYKAGRIARNGKIKNIGIKKANGDYIAFIDSDDLWHQEKIEKQLTALRRYPQAGFSMTGGYNFRIPDEPIDYFYKQDSLIKCENILVPFFRSQVSATTPSLLLRKTCLTKVGLFNEMKPFSDVDFILRLASSYLAVILYEPLLYRRLHPANDSGRNWIEGYKEGIELIKTYRKKIPARIAGEAFFHLYLRFGEDCLSHNQKLQALKNFSKAWICKPQSVIPLKKTGKLVYRIIKNQTVEND